VPLQTLRVPIDYGFAEARTLYGVIGVKCWITRKDDDAIDAQAGASGQRPPRRDNRDNRDSRPQRG
jgi:small subunit ribosomal protein S3